MDDPRPVKIHSIARRDAATLMPAPVKARPAPLARRMTAEDAFRATLLECLGQVSVNALAVRAGHAPENLHQLRVGLKRLQVALHSFGPVCELPRFQEMALRTKAVARKMSVARDLDVFLGSLMKPPQRLAQPGVFEPLIARAEEARRQAWAEARACVESTDFGRFLDDVAAAAEEPRGHSRLKPVVTAALNAHLKKVKKRGRKARSAKDADLHRLRISIKKLRYAGEFFAPLYRHAAVKAYRNRLKAMQASLGDLQDVSALRTILAGLMEDPPESPIESKRKQADLAFAAGQMQGWYNSRAGKLEKKARKQWKKFRRVTPYWH